MGRNLLNLVRGGLRHSRLGWRKLNWAKRPLPSFLIIGAQKAGTSSLFSYLSQHPELTPSFKKEVHFFDGGLNPNHDNYAKGEKWYRAHFPSVPEPDICRGAFEASPSYLFSPLCAGRIAALIPDVRLIMLLREPTERAISHFSHESRKGRETLPIEEALACEENRLEEANASGDFKHSSYIHFSYKARGRYAEQFRRYLQFFTRDQIMVISSELLFARPLLVLDRVFEFVGVSREYVVEDLSPRNVAESKNPVAETTRRQLQDYFRPYNYELQDLLGEDLGWLCKHEDVRDVGRSQ